MERDKIDYEADIFKKNNRLLAYFWLGFIVYTVSFAIYTTDILNRVFCVSVQLIGLILLLPAAYRLISFKIENNYLKTIYILYFGWLLTVIFRGFIFDSVFLKYMLFNPFNGIFLYLVPLVLFFPSELEYYKHVFNTIVTLALFFIFYDLLFVNYLVHDIAGKGQSLIEYFSLTLSIPAGFILLTYIYHSNKRNLLALITILLMILFAIIRARRGLVFISGSIFASFILIYCYINRRNSRAFLTLLSFFLIAILADNFDNPYQNLGIFNNLNNRIGEDTRTTVVDYFYAGMTQKDWIVGKGINGMYYAPTGEEDNPKAPYRDGIENNYLNIILKGGIISLALLLLIAVPAIFKGLFFSKNMLSKASAIWILLWMLDLYPSTVTTFTLNYLLVWISIGVCYSKEIRSLTDKDIQDALKSNSYPGDNNLELI
ncbi:MAG TPA: hypothetical protein VIJ75_12000 [Hanamia sp.]